MLDWDYDTTNKICRMVMYVPDYDSEIEDKKTSFIISDLTKKINEFHELIDSHGDDEEFLVGINSNSLNDINKHNIFLEWDNDEYIPPMEELNKIDGIISQTEGGIHLIKEASISPSELYDLQKKYRCCTGFGKYAGIKGYSTLRVTPKKDNIIKILKYKDGLLYNVYRELVVNLGGVLV